jgi:hypothetical protein
MISANTVPPRERLPEGSESTYAFPRQAMFVVGKGYGSIGAVTRPSPGIIDLADWVSELL